MRLPYPITPLLPNTVWRALRPFLTDSIVWRRRDLYCRKHGHLWTVSADDSRCLWCGVR